MADVGKISAMRIAMSYGPELSFLVLLRILIGMYRSDIIDRESRVRPSLAPQNSYDFVIIGGGSAGSVLANRLSENKNWTVLLLEAGADEPDFSDVPLMFPVLQLTPIDWQFKTEPSDNYCKAMRAHECNWPRGKVSPFYIRFYSNNKFYNKIFCYLPSTKSFDQVVQASVAHLYVCQVYYVIHVRSENRKLF